MLSYHLPSNYTLPTTFFFPLHSPSDTVLLFFTFQFHLEFNSKYHYLDIQHFSHNLIILNNLVMIMNLEHFNNNLTLLTIDYSY